MELPGELKPDLHRTLLGPLSLATEIFGALIPGCVFMILVGIKRQWATAILSYPLVGYKSKIAVALLASYILGKVVLSIVALSVELLKWFAEKLKTKEAQKPQPAANQLQVLATLVSEYLGSASESFRAFIGGLVAGPILSGKFQAFEHYAAHEASTLFHLSTGLIFILCAAIPGDGNFRVIEGVAGALLLLRGVRSISQSEQIVAGFLGVALNQYLRDLQPRQVASGLKAAWAVIAQLSKTPVPTPADSPSAAPSPTASPVVGPSVEARVQEPKVS